MRAVFFLLAAVAVVCASCSPTPPTQGPAQDGKIRFGLPNEFSGRLTEEHRSAAAEAIRDAYYVESVQDITSAELERVAQGTDLVAEETRDGVWYVALRDIRCIHFDNGVSGQMFVIERYRIAPVPSPLPLR